MERISPDHRVIETLFLKTKKQLSYICITSLRTCKVWLTIYYIDHLVPTCMYCTCSAVGFPCPKQDKLTLCSCILALSLLCRVKLPLVCYYEDACLYLKAGGSPCVAPRQATGPLSMCLLLCTSEDSFLYLKAGETVLVLFFF